MKRIAIFASGSGTNAEALAKYFKDSEVARVQVCLCNRRQAGVYDRMEQQGIPCHFFPKAAWEDGSEVLRLMRDLKIDIIALAGFLAYVPASLLQAYPKAIVNIHPSLLPRHGGPGMYGAKVHQAVLDAGDKESGITLHYVNNVVDGGEIIFQAKCPVLPGDDAGALAQRVHALEHEHFPKVLEGLLAQ